MPVLRLTLQAGQTHIRSEFLDLGQQEHVLHFLTSHRYSRKLDDDVGINDGDAYLDVLLEDLSHSAYWSIEEEDA